MHEVTPSYSTADEWCACNGAASTELPSPTSRDETRINYSDLIQSQLNRLFPKFVANVQTQSFTQREKGRAAVIEYPEGAFSEQKVFKSSAELQEYINAFPLDQERGPMRRLSYWKTSHEIL
jgi:hypothetical protein